MLIVAIEALFPVEALGTGGVKIERGKVEMLFVSAGGLAVVEALFTVG